MIKWLFLIASIGCLYNALGLVDKEDEDEFDEYDEDFDEDEAKEMIASIYKKAEPEISDPKKERNEKILYWILTIVFFVLFWTFK